MLFVVSSCILVRNLFDYKMERRKDVNILKKSTKINIWPNVR